jgi:hypothetical protein
MDLPSVAEPAEKERPYISTGHLPEPETVQKLVTDAHQRFKSNTDGENSQVYPALARVPRDLFGLCVVGTSGRVHGAGDIEYEFSIMSVSKPFVFALICETIGPEAARDKLGANATGLPFNSLAAIEQGGGRTNPMVNAGAIATTSLARPSKPSGSSSMTDCRASPGETCNSMKRSTPRRRIPISETAVSPACCRAMSASIVTLRSQPTSTPGSAHSM